VAEVGVAEVGVAEVGGAEVGVAGSGDADAATLRIVLAAVQAALGAAEPTAAVVQNRWRFSGREWAGPGPIRRARP
jgi:hypothetical protein